MSSFWSRPHPGPPSWAQFGSSITMEIEVHGYALRESEPGGADEHEPQQRRHLLR